MKKEKFSEFIYTVDLDHETGMWGVGNIKEFYSRAEALTFAESMARNNPDMSVSVNVWPRIRKKNILKTS